MKRNTGAVNLVLLIVLGAIVLAGLGLYSYAVNIRNQALAWETNLNTVYRSYENEMATYVNTFYEQTGLANLKSEKMNEFIRGALEGRFGDSPKATSDNLLFTAVAEAYPGTEGFNVYDKILPTVAAGREGMRNKQNLVIEVAQKYNNWRKQGIFRSWVLSGVYPSQDLQIKVGSRTLYGVEALNHLSEPITNAATDKAFETHQMEPLNLNPKK